VHLTRLSDSDRRTRQRALLVVAVALESVVKTLAGMPSGTAESGGTAEPGQVLQALGVRRVEPDAARQGRRQLSFYGWSVDRGWPTEVLRLEQSVLGRAGTESGASGGCGSMAENSGSSSSDDEASTGAGAGAIQDRSTQLIRARRLRTRVVSASVLELASCKLGAIRTAIELACALVAVDGFSIDSR